MKPGEEFIAWYLLHPLEIREKISAHVNWKEVVKLRLKEECISGLEELLNE